MNEIATSIDSYLAAYCEPDKASRAEVVRRVWVQDGRLIDPPLAAQGHEQIIGQADQLLSQFPGHRFRRSSGVDTHHGWSRYGWQLCDATGQVARKAAISRESTTVGGWNRSSDFSGRCRRTKLLSPCT